jgi:hypothetical protein
LALLLLATGCTETVLGGCFDTFAAPASFSERTICTNGMWLWEVRMFQPVFYIPNAGSDCSDDCSITNVTLAGGVLVSYDASPSQVPPGGGLVVIDCLFQQIPGATSADVVIDSPCVSLGGSVDYPELIGVTIDLTHALPSEVRLCWNSRTNTSYLGDPVTGNGATNCVTDASAEPGRFYRVTIPP